jgi:hypothetical protein
VLLRMQQQGGQDETISHRNLGDLWHELALDSPAEKKSSFSEIGCRILTPLTGGPIEMRPNGGGAAKQGLIQRNGASDLKKSRLLKENVILLRNLLRQFVFCHGRSQRLGRCVF